MKTNIFLVLILFLLMPLLTWAQVMPNWVKDTPQDNLYYIGITSVDKSFPDYKEVATKKALAIMSEQIQVNISSSKDLFTSENRYGLEQDFNQAVKSRTKIELQEYDLFDTWEDNNQYYVYYRLSKKVYRDNLMVAFENAIINSNELIALANVAISENRIADAIRAYLDASTFLEILRYNTFIKDQHAKIFNNWNLIIRELTKTFQRFDISSRDKQFSISQNELFTNEFSVGVYYQSSGYDVEVEQMPVVFTLSNNHNAFEKRVKFSNYRGLAQNRIKNVYNESNNYIISCSLDFERYLNGFGEYQVLQELELSSFNKEIEISLKVNPVKIFISIDDLLIEDKHLVLTEISALLMKNNFIIVSNLEESDYRIRLSGKIENGAEFQGLYSAFLSVTYSVSHTSNSKLLYSGVFYDVKGMGLNYNQARKNSIKNFNEELETKLVDIIVKQLQYVNY